MSPASPVFAGNASGSLLRPARRGGYIIGFVFAAVVVGWLANLRLGPSRSEDPRCRSSIGSLVIYAFGLPWLAASLDLGEAVWSTSAVLIGDALPASCPFLIGGALKALIAAACCPAPGRVAPRSAPRDG